MIDNFDLIKPMLEWRSEDDFYFLQILQRKKDHDKGKVNGTNNNSRLIKAYYLKSQDQLNFIEPEIRHLCDLFQARAGINLNRRSFKKMSLQHLRKITDQILNEDYRKAYKAYSTVVGHYNHDSDKKWILDVDQELNATDKAILIKVLRTFDPVGAKVIAWLPSKSGWHIITKPFNLMQMEGTVLKDKYAIDVHKNNPTNLYIP